MKLNKNNKWVVITAIHVLISRTKHIEVRYNFIRKCVEDEKVNLRYIRTEDPLADLFTKSLRISKFCKFQKEIGLGRVKRSSD